ncbi:hypothetical protein ACUV84_018855 [Puccinellia chinampoensis]
MALNVVAAAVLAAAGVLAAFFSWPAACAMMKAPGAPGCHICRDAFEANPQHYFELLRREDAEAAAGAFAA